MTIDYKDILDLRDGIAKIDKENVLRSIELLSEQCRHSWEDVEKIHVPVYKDIKAVVMCGMGGSGLGARLIESVYADEIKIPLIRINDYDLPRFVDKNTLVICSSYSGETEETLSNARQAIKAGAKWMAIGGGNTLIAMAKEAKVPFYQITPSYNPCNQPRMAIGYSVVGQLSLAHKVGLIAFKKEDVDLIFNTNKEVLNKIKVEIGERKNEAKKLALKMKNKFVFYISARHLVGAMHVVNNQNNENAKTFTMDFAIPELNHHLMEGLSHPPFEIKNLFAFFADSNLYPDKIRKRLRITKDIVEKHGIDTYVYQVKSEKEISQAFELIQFGIYVNFYLAILYGQNPAPLPWVDYLKNRLGQPLGK